MVRILAGEMSSSGVLVHVAGCDLKTFAISATVGLQGQVVRMPIRVEYPEYKKPAVVIAIQKRHKCARFSMDLFSDYEESIPILVQTILSSGVLPHAQERRKTTC